MVHTCPVGIYPAETFGSPRVSAQAGYWMLVQEETDASEMSSKRPVLFCLHCWWLDGGEGKC